MNDKLTFAPADFFVFRTSLLPLDEFQTWSDGLEAPAALDDSTRLEEAFARDRALLRERLSTIMSRPEVWDAVFVASPDLDKFLDSWRREPDTKRGRNTERALVRYFSRMAGRATPFGLFAGTSVGRLGSDTKLLIAGRAQYRRHTRLDMDYLFALVDTLGRDPSLRNLFSYRPNSSLYRAAGRVRYVESRLDGKNRSYHLVAVEETDYLEATVASAREGATPVTLAEALVTPEVSFADATEYIGQLIESQILIPDVALAVTGPEPIHPLVNQLSEHADTTHTAGLLSQTRAELAAIDGAGLGVEPQRYRAVADLLESLPAKVELSRLFQVDMFKPAPDATLGEGVVAEIAHGVELLHRLAVRPPADVLTRFREAFVERYDQREVPLIEALDEEIGIGFGTGGMAEPLVRDLVFPPADEETTTDSARQSFLLRKLSEALQHGAQEIVLEPRKLEEIKTKDPLPLPDAFAAMATLVSPSQEALARGDFRVVMNSTIGPSGASLLGRFCHADESLRASVERHLRAEESFQPDAVFAEIVYLPEGRMGNVLSRPVLRDYEIPYLGRSGAPPERQISLTDLHVSVRGERIRLRSASLQREVIPRLTSAHRYSSGSLGVYRFLGMLQQQGIRGWLRWDWDTLSSAPFLPRVTMGRLVLSLARWSVRKEELRLLSESQGAARFRAVQLWRAERQLPRLVALADADNVLPIDLDNALSVESFVHLTREREAVVLTELLPGPDELCAQGPEGRFVHELIVPFVKIKDDGGGIGVEIEEDHSFHPSSLIPHPSSFIPHPFPRRFPPSSEWLYVKLYTGVATVDHILRDLIRPLVDEALTSGAADSWFFIRYDDTDWHLRLRFHGAPKNLLTKVFPAIHAAVAPLMDDGRVWRVQLDTYEREVERYGGAEGMVLAERLFHIDSDAVLEIVEMLEPGDGGADERWRLALRGIDSLLTDFNFNVEVKHIVLKQVREAFAREFRVDQNLRSQLSEKYRRDRKNLESLFNPAPNEDSPLSPGFAVLRHRSERLTHIIAELKSCEQSGRLSLPLMELMPNYIHMHVNRLLRTDHRAQEMVLYDFLTRFYESQVVRTRSEDFEKFEKIRPGHNLWLEI